MSKEHGKSPSYVRIESQANRLPYPPTITRHEFLKLFGFGILGAAGGGVLAETILSKGKPGLELSADVQFPQRGGTTGEDLFVLTENNAFLTPEIKDRPLYEEAARRLGDFVLPKINPEYLINHPFLNSAFNNLSELTNEELQNRITLVSASQNSETGYQDGLFRGTSFFIRDDLGRVVLGGYLQEDDDKYAKISVQIDEKLEIVPGEVDKTVRLTKADYEKALSSFFNLNLPGIREDDSANRELGVQFTKVLPGGKTRDITSFSVFPNGFMRMESWTEKIPVDPRNST